MYVDCDDFSGLYVLGIEESDPFEPLNPAGCDWLPS